jgi:hypothetical protein
MPKKEPIPARNAQDRTILINFVLDKSGSMDVIRDATISGFNEFKGDQAREEGKAFFTLTLFDTQFTTVSQAAPVREVPDLDHASYRPSGCTALYDAIGYTMRDTDDFVAANRPDQVLFVIMTDGAENSSREFSRDRIFQMIQDRQKNTQYEFIYLGANQDSYIAGHAMGLRDGRMMDYAHDPASAGTTLRRASHNVSAYRRHGKKGRDEFFNPELERLGSIDPEVWNSMNDSDRRTWLTQSEEQRPSGDDQNT